MSWSGIHDGCPLHGHATDQSKADIVGGCICQELEGFRTRITELERRNKALCNRTDEAARALQEGASFAPATHAQWFGDIACRLRAALAREEKP